MSSILQDDVIILQVKAYETADKYVLGFTRDNGKVRFIAYGARYPKNKNGRLLQPFSELHLELQQGARIDKLRSVELVQIPHSYDMQQMAYASLATELVAILTEDRQPQEELYELLKAALALLKERNPRIVVLAFAIKLLQLVGVAPQMEACVSCGKTVEQEQEASFNGLQGGLVCENCARKMQGDGYEHCGPGTRTLWRSLLLLNMEQPERFLIKGIDLMELEKLLFKYLYFQTDKEINSLKFILQMQGK